jgi:hypothetical protein
MHNHRAHFALQESLEPLPTGLFKLLEIRLGGADIIVIITHFNYCQTHNPHEYFRLCGYHILQLTPPKNTGTWNRYFEF